MRFKTLLALFLLCNCSFAANEFAVVVPSGSTGVYGVIVNPYNQAQGYDATTNDGSTYLAFDRTDSDQQISFGSAIAVSASDERQFATLPSSLSTGQEHLILIFDSSDELLGSFRYVPQYGSLETPDVNVASLADDVITADKIATDAIGSSELAASAATEIEDAVLDAARNDHNDADSIGAALNEILVDTQELVPDLNAVLVDTNELQTDWTNGGRLDLLLDGVNTDTDDLIADLAAVDLVVTNVLADTNELQTDWGNGGRLDLLLDATLADTSELQTNQGGWLTATGFATSAALAAVDANVDSILADTAELQTNQGDWATATGFATAVNLATVDANIDSILVDTAELQSDWADGGRLDLILDTAASGSVDEASIADAVWDEVASGHATVGTFGEYLAGVYSKLPGGGRNMAGAGDTATDLDDITTASENGSVAGATLTVVSGTTSEVVVTPPTGITTAHCLNAVVTPVTSGRVQSHSRITAVSVTGSNLTLTLSPPLADTPQVGDTLKLGSRYLGEL